MRPGQQNRRNRGRTPRRSNNNNSNSRNFESNGPDVKIRGTANHVAEKYAALARDAMASGSTVLAENYLQHAEHYNRIIQAVQEKRDEVAANNTANNVSAGNQNGQGKQQQQQRRTPIGRRDKHKDPQAEKTSGPDAAPQTQATVKNEQVAIAGSGEQPKVTAPVKNGQDGSPAATEGEKATAAPKAPRRKTAKAKSEETVAQEAPAMDAK